MKRLNRTIARNTSPILALVLALALFMGSDALVQAQGYGGDKSGEPDASFTLVSAFQDGQYLYIGKGGEIDGKVNPTLRVQNGALVEITLISGDGAVHDIKLPQFDAQSEKVMGSGAKKKDTIRFVGGTDGKYTYFCTIPTHRKLGMEGKLVVGDGPQAESMKDAAADLALPPDSVPEPIGDRGPKRVSVEMTTVEKTGQLADGTQYKFWTFNGNIPGPFVRVRVGDTVDFHLKNAPSSQNIHSIDLHAVNGPGGGSKVTQTPPGEESTFSFKVVNPGLYVYHCATPMVPHHIANGMYGLILVEPEGGLPEVDREFYVMQGELYTSEEYGTSGTLSFDTEKLLDEDPEYYFFNGAVGALTKRHPLKAETGETARIYFGVGGPNKTSAFHVIGEQFERVYKEASLTTDPLTDVQTTTVSPGAATVVDMTLEVPGEYLLVDHALSRLGRGLVGHLIVEGEPNPDVFSGGPGQ